MNSLPSKKLVSMITLPERILLGRTDVPASTMFCQVLVLFGITKPNSNIQCSTIHIIVRYIVFLVYFKSLKAKHLLIFPWSLMCCTRRSCLIIFWEEKLISRATCLHERISFGTWISITLSLSNTSRCEKFSFHISFPPELIFIQLLESEGMLIFIVIFWLCHLERQNAHLHSKSLIRWV